MVRHFLCSMTALLIEVGCELGNNGNQARFGCDSGRKKQRSEVV
jgi:hypothetical protein